MIDMCDILVNFLLNADCILDCKGKGDVVFILDTSGSVGRNGFYKVLNFTYQAISDLDIDSGNFRVAVITFSNWPRLEFDLSE